MLLHEELRQAREALGLTQAQLASLAGIPRNQIVRAEKGENITLETLRKIVVHLPVENLTLLEGVDLGFDHLPQAERLYATASKMMINLTGFFMTALEVMMEARLARDVARQTAELEPEDERLPLRALKNTLLELRESLQEDPKTLAEVIQAAEFLQTIEVDGQTVENDGSTVESDGSTVESDGSTVEINGSTVEKNG